jgi:GMP synthase (glutamine-hydrolysing)
MKTLIINSYRVDSEEKIAPFIEMVEKFSSFQVVNDVDLFSHIRFIDYNALVLSGSGDLISRGAYSKSYVEFLRYNTIPCLAICYGHQMLAMTYGATIFSALHRIDQNETIRVIKQDRLFKDLPPEFIALENHIEHVTLKDLPSAGFELLANSPSCEVEAIKHIEHCFYGVQFHPERSGIIGETIFKNFFDIILEKSCDRSSSTRL